MRTAKFLLLAFLALAACDPDKEAAQQKAERIISALKNYEIPRLSTLVHPTEGLRFAPYYTLNMQTDRAFTVQELQIAPRDRDSFNWGDADGSGEPIVLSFRRYFDRFVWDRDFSAVQPLINQDAPRTSGMPDNVQKIYPGAMVFSYHVPGSEKTKGMDFRTLRLIMQKHENKWYLIHISHDQWMI